MTELTDLLRSGMVNSLSLRDYLYQMSVSVQRGLNMPDWTRSLDALAYATEIYDGLSGATVSLAVMKKPLYKAQWYSSDPYPRFNLCTLSLALRTHYRHASFACIALFESGTLDIAINTFTSVMALSSGNSLYIANCLLRDPINAYGEDHRWRGITRILGNLNRPGIVVLAPPPELRIRAEDLNAWKLIKHANFDGQIEDSFKHTSLHLHFTKYEVPIEVSIGAIDAQAMMLETLISVYDSKDWLDDLDILGGMENEKFYKFHILPCIHDRAESSLSPLKNIAVLLTRFTQKRLISLDIWDEMLDPPEELGVTSIGVVRAGTNMQARLAAMSLSVQKKYRTVLLPLTPVCTVCGLEALKNVAGFVDVFIL